MWIGCTCFFLCCIGAYYIGARAGRKKLIDGINSKYNNYTVEEMNCIWLVKQADESVVNLYKMIYDLIKPTLAMLMVGLVLTLLGNQYLKMFVRNDITIPMDGIWYVFIPLLTILLFVITLRFYCELDSLVVR